ncbi:hypothetical protein [Cupriavidus gilardii]|uniref:hypothetical protein n=1 Tax=Cupriavidus gilardii TaxID=82541 RepID=UPI0021C1E410|nr:hypothetical protein [Cupriavidus gilardii]MCT9125390.1 hypothetical protein [Cupriavidus gilardii]
MSKTIGSELRAAFLRGERIVIAEFARAHGQSRQAVFSAMKQFKDMVKATKHRGALVWECVDAAGMRAHLPHGKRPEPEAPATLEFVGSDRWAALLASWNINHADIELPAYRHRMSSEEGAGL